MQKIKLFHVLECGDFGGTGRYVANVCNKLNPDLFEVTLVYGLRPGAALSEFEDLFLLISKFSVLASGLAIVASEFVWLIENFMILKRYATAN